LGQSRKRQDRGGGGAGDDFKFPVYNISYFRFFIFLSESNFFFSKLAQ
jgi:hypothetical protein